MYNDGLRKRLENVFLNELPGPFIVSLLSLLVLAQCKDRLYFTSASVIITFLSLHLLNRILFFDLLINLVIRLRERFEVPYSLYCRRL